MYLMEGLDWWLSRKWTPETRVPRKQRPTWKWRPAENSICVVKDQVLHFGGVFGLPFLDTCQHISIDILVDTSEVIVGGCTNTLPITSLMLNLVNTLSAVICDWHTVFKLIIAKCFTVWHTFASTYICSCALPKQRWNAALSSETLMHRS